MKNTLTPHQLLKKKIVGRINSQNYNDFHEPIGTPEEIEAAYDLAVFKRIHWDFVEEVRDSGIKTDLPAPFNRNYEIDIHAHFIDNQWVAFPYYYGGGKYGEPGAMPWMEESFFVDCKEEERVVTVRTFSKKKE